MDRIVTNLNWGRETLHNCQTYRILQSTTKNHTIPVYILCQVCINYGTVSIIVILIPMDFLLLLFFFFKQLLVVCVHCQHMTLTAVYTKS